MTQKTCKQCGKTDNEDKFVKNRILCKSCHSENGRKQREQEKKQRKEDLKNNVHRDCSKCGENKHCKEFIGTRRVCSSCRKNLDKKKRNKEKETITQNAKNNMTKECSKCLKDKSYSRFRPGTNICKDCSNSRKRELKDSRSKRLEEEKDLNELNGLTKKCTYCLETKDFSNYASGSARCKDCVNKIRREKRAEKKKALGKSEKQPSNSDNKICKYCNVESHKSNFRPKRRKCLNCERKDGREFRQSEYGKEKSRAWKGNNQEKMTELQANWHQNNKEKINQKYRNRYNEDFIFKLKVNLKSRLNGCLNSNNIKKNGRTMDYIGCNQYHVKEWLESCFTDKMTIKNHGPYWHIDHVIPINTFDLNEKDNEKLCFSWYNLSPMKGSENMSKHDSIDKKQIKSHIKKLLDFDKKDGVPIEYYKLCKSYLK